MADRESSKEDAGSVSQVGQTPRQQANQVKGEIETTEQGGECRYEKHR